MSREQMSRLIDETTRKMPIPPHPSLSHPSHLLALLLLVYNTTTHAHVRMSGSKQKYADNLLPIRNAPSIGADGRASVGGPCGGTKKWRPDNQPPEVLYGGKVQVSLEYAAGHESPSNLFVVTMACSSPDESDLVADSAKATILSSAVCRTIEGGTRYPVPAFTGRDAKVIECSLPLLSNLKGDQDGAPDENQGRCSLSVQDQRKWGGCVDFLYVAKLTAAGGDAASAASTTPPSAPLVEMISSTVTSIVTSGPPPKLPCCGLSSADLTLSAGDTTSSGATTVRLSGSATGGNCNAGLKFPSNTITLQMSNDGGKSVAGLTLAAPLMLFGEPGDQVFSTTNAVMLGQTMAAAKFVSSGVLSIVMLGDPSANPTVCDTEITFVPRPRPEPRPEPEPVAKEKTYGAPCREGGRCAGSDNLSGGSSSRRAFSFLLLFLMVGVIMVGVVL